MRVEKDKTKSSLPQRRSIRLSTHNYQWTASYFITIRAHHHEPVFEIPELFSIVTQQWTDLSTRFPHIQLDEYIVMPDHMHSIVHLVTTETTSPPLQQVIGAYKSLTTVEWFRYVKTHNVEWQGLLWQKRFHDHVIRDVSDLEQKRQYIRENPLRWQTHTNPYK